MKVLIIAFPRSGTTLTFRIFEQHPKIEKGYFETKLLRKFPYKEKLLNFYEFFSEGRNCVEKIIYEGRKFGLKTSDTPIMYCDRWNQFFGKESKIIQIIRDPRDVWNSLILNEYLKRNWEHIIIRRLSDYFDFFGNILNSISNYENSFILKYEDLIMNPKKMIKQLYNFCGLDATYKFKEEMKTQKVFLYKEIGMRIDNEPRLKKYKKEFNDIFYDRLPEMINTLNEFPGIKYEI